MAEDAQRCMQELDRKRQDITMLWLLKDTGWLERAKATRELRAWVQNTMGVRLQVAGGDKFQREVRRVFQERGVLPVAPERVVESWRKDTAKDMCLNAQWPKPCFPVMLQTRPGSEDRGAGAFVVFSCWQDAMHALVKMSKTRSYKAPQRSYAADVVYENQLVDMGGYDLPCRLILDCDAKVSEFDGRFTVEELDEVIDGAAEWFSRRMVEVGVISPEAAVVVYEKDKSRKGKASRHLIFNVLGYSTWDLQAILRLIVGAEVEKEKQAEASAKAKEQTRMPFDGKRPPAWRLIDTVPHHGRGQYSVMGFYDAKRKGEVEYPCIKRRLTIVHGRRVAPPRPCVIAREDSDLSHAMALNMLHRTCFTCLVHDFITIDPKFMVQRTPVSQKQEKNMPAARLELTRTPGVAGKKRGWRGPKRWTKQRAPSRHRAVVPAAVGRVRLCQDHGRAGGGVWRQHKHALPQPPPLHPQQASPQCAEGENGPHLPRPLLSLPGVQRHPQSPRVEWHICSGGRGWRRDVC